MPRSEIHEVVTPKRVAAATRLPTPLVRAALDSQKRVIDGLVAMDVPVLTPVMTIANRDDPLAKWVDRLSHDDYDRFELHLQSWIDADSDTLLGTRLIEVLGPSDLQGRTLVTLWDLTTDVIETTTRLADADHDVADNVIRATNCFWRLAAKESDRGTRYEWRCSRPSAEVDFETWLVANLDRLERFGYPLELLDQPYGRQWRTPSGTRADLICRYRRPIEDRRIGDLVVIENKVLPAWPEVIAQIHGYIDAVTSELAAPTEVVDGLVIAAGTTRLFLEALDELATPDPSVDYISVASLGYYDDLFGTQLVAQSGQTPAPTSGTVASPPVT